MLVESFWTRKRRDAKGVPAYHEYTAGHAALAMVVDALRER
jgi:hypothetical protein